MADNARVLLSIFLLLLITSSPAGCRVLSMPVCLIGLGSNLGDRLALLETAIQELRRDDGLRVVRQSRWHETAPAGGPPGQHAFLNGAVLVETELTPQGVLELLKQIERGSGRQRLQRWGPRTLDLDLLLFDDLVLETPELTLPHPRMAWRRFVLEPAAEVAPDMIHPTTGWTIGRLLEHLNTAAPYVAIAGPVGAGKTRLAEQFARAADARWIVDPVAPDFPDTFSRDPSGSGLDVELKFLQRRAELLSLDRPGWYDQLSVSDFWFDQSIVYAGVRLPPDQIDAFGQQWETARRRVVKPKLIVLLDAPAEELERRIRDRAGPAARELSAEVLDQLRRAILAELSRPGQGPVFPLLGDDPHWLVTEIMAAVDSMR